MLVEWLSVWHFQHLCPVEVVRERMMDMLEDVGWDNYSLGFGMKTRENG